MSTHRFQKTIDRLFHHFGMDARYQRLGQAPQPVRVIRRQSDPSVTLNERPLFVHQIQLEARRRELSVPKRGEHLMIEDQRYRIEDEPQLDQHQLIWRMTVVLESSLTPPSTMNPSSESPTPPRLRIR